MASCPKKGPQRFSAGEILRGSFETTTNDGGVCFRVDRVDDFVFFPPGAVSYREEPQKKKEEDDEDR